MNIVVSRKGEAHIAVWGKGPRICAVGRGGLGIKQREGDGITPVGAWPLRHGFYRADRIAKPVMHLPLTPIAPGDAWCDIPGDPNYNRLVHLPEASREERLWREDGLYDLLAVVGFNDDPVVPGKGSAIFIHLARASFGSTEGCVAMALDDLREALVQFEPGDRLIIEAP